MRTMAKFGTCGKNYFLQVICIERFQKLALVKLNKRLFERGSVVPNSA